MMRNTLLSILICLLCAGTAQPENYAVIITGDDPYQNQDSSSWNGGSTDDTFIGEFWNDTFLMWEALWTYGWKDENIYVLYADGQDFYRENPRYQPSRYSEYGILSITDYAATPDNVETVFLGLANGDSSLGIPQMTEDDFLYVYTFDHGHYYSQTGHVSLQLWGPGGTFAEMMDTTFAQLVDSITCDKRCFFMQQCFSGGFIEDLEDSSTYIMTAVNYTIAGTADDNNPDGLDSLENEYYAPEDSFYTHGEFNYHVINAMRLQTIIGNPLSDPDLNSDGLTSAREIKLWEFEKDT